MSQLNFHDGQTLTVKYTGNEMASATVSQVCYYEI